MDNFLVIMSIMFGHIWDIFLIFWTFFGHIFCNDNWDAIVQNMSKLLDKLWTYFRHISLNWTSFECLCISVQNMLTRIQNVGHILDIISYFEHLLDIFWTFFAKICPNLLVWAHLGHILGTLCKNVSKKCPSLHRAGAPQFLSLICLNY